MGGTEGQQGGANVTMSHVCGTRSPATGNTQQLSSALTDADNRHEQRNTAIQQGKREASPEHVAEQPAMRQLHFKLPQRRRGAGPQAAAPQAVRCADAEARGQDEAVQRGEAAPC